MNQVSLPQVAEELLSRAHAENAGRAAHNLLAGREHALSQTMITLVAGHELAEHDSPPGDATLQVLRGRVRLTSGADVVELSEGDYLPIPPERHSVAADEDAVLLLTVVKR